MDIEGKLFAFGRAILATLPAPLADKARAAKREILNRRSPEKVFDRIYRGNTWDGTESVSGPGSTASATASVRAQLPGLLAEIGATSLLDIPCGDAYWIGDCLPPGVAYTGADIVPEIVARNAAQRGAMGRFIVCNLVTDPLPAADVALVRDCFIHLSNSMVQAALDNLRGANIRYLLTTTFPDHADNRDIEVGGFRPVDLVKPPFSLAAPLRLIPDMAPHERNNKHLGLWALRQ